MSYHFFKLKKYLKWMNGFLLLAQYFRVSTFLDIIHLESVVLNFFLYIALVF
jgi:hypothetical protein